MAINFPDLQPIRKGSLPNPQATTTLESIFCRDSRIYLQSRSSVRKDRNKIKTQINQSYRARNNRNASEKLRNELRNNLTSLYQKGLNSFYEEKEEIKIKKQKNGFVSNNLELLFSTVSQCPKSFYLTQKKNENTQSIKSRQYIIKNPLRYRSNKVRSQRNQPKTHERPLFNRVNKRDKRYKELTLTQIIQTQSKNRLFNFRKETDQIVHEVYEGW